MWLCALIVLVLWGGADPAHAESAANYEHYGSRQGLAIGEVVSIAEDHEGYLWVATFSAGVHRFDGRRFERFGDEHGLTSKRTKRVHVDRTGHVRIATLNGLFVFENDRFVQDPTLGNVGIFDVLETKDGAFWYATDAGAVRIAQGQTLRLDKQDGLPRISTTALAEGPHGEVWIGTTRGVCRFENGKLEFWARQDASMTRDYVTRLQVDDQGQLWMATDWGVERFDGQQFHRLDLGVGDRHLYVLDLVFDPQKHLRIATVGAGVLRWDGERISQLGPAQGGPSPNIWSLALSQTGGLWIGTQEHGLVLREAGAFDSVVSLEGLAGAVPDAITRTSEGELIVGTAGAGIVRIDEKKLHLVGDPEPMRALSTRDGLPNEFITQFLPGSAGMWIGTRAGPAFWDGRQIIALDPAREPWPVRGMCEDAEGYLWMANKEQGLVRYRRENDKWQMDHFRVSQQARVPFWSLARATNGDFWLGATQAVYQFDGKKYQHWPADKLSSADRVKQILFDTEKRFWFFSDEALGIVEINGEQANWTVIDLPRVAWLVLAPNGEVLASAEDGLHRLRANPEGRVERIGTVSPADGYPPDTPNAHGVFWDTDGTLVFGTPHGVFRYQPNRVRASSKVHIHLRRLFVSGDSQPLPQSENPLVLSHNQNFVSLEFDATAFPAPDSIEFRYRVEGMSETWSPPTLARTAIFSNLPPGTHRFRIQARHGGQWDSEVVSGPIQILPAYWQTWWFRGLGGSLILAIALAIPILRARNLAKQRDRLENEVAQRTAELAQYSEKLEVLVEQRTSELEQTYQDLLAREEERNRATEAAAAAYRQAALGRLAGVVAHQVNTPLAAIKARLSLVRSDPYVGPDAESSLLVIERQVDRIARIVRELLGFVRQREVGAENQPIAVVIQSVVDLYAEAMRSKGVTVTMDLPAERLYVSGSSHDLQELVLNLVENAREAVATGGNIRVAVERQDDSIRLVVEDDGAGLGANPERLFQPFFTTKTTGTGLGLAIARRIAETLGGKLVGENRIEDGPGARFVLTLPLAHLSEAT